MSFEDIQPFLIRPRKKTNIRRVKNKIYNLLQLLDVKLQEAQKNNDYETYEKLRHLYEFLNEWLSKKEKGIYI